MTEFAGIFEVLAADQSDARLASRKALVLSRDRIDARLGKFLGASRSPQEFDARFDLVSEDFEGIVRVAADEVGHEDPASLIETLHEHYRQAGKPPWLKGDDDEKDDEKDDAKDKDEKKDTEPKDEQDEGTIDPKSKDDKDDAPDEELTFGASVRTAAPEGNTGLAGPSPKIDKARWTPKSVTPIDVPSKRHPTVQKDITEPLERENLTKPAHDMDEINSLTTTETLPTGTGMDDAGFNADKDTGTSGPTKTWGTDGREADPVRSESLEA
jgi:hypothetical protein